MVTTASAAGAEVPTGAYVAAQQPVVVHSCNRLGRIANPPSFSFTEWLLRGRRR